MKQSGTFMLSCGDDLDIEIHYTATPRGVTLGQYAYLHGLWPGNSRGMAVDIDDILTPHAQTDIRWNKIHRCIYDEE